MVMAGPTHRPGLAAIIVGTLLLSEVLFLRVAFSADLDHVYFAGEQLSTACSFKEKFSVPCPTCGMTRSIVLAAQGDLRSASRVNPAGAVGMVGVILFILTMFGLAILQRRKPHRKTRSLERRITTWTLAYAALTILVLLGHWLMALRA